MKALISSLLICFALDTQASDFFLIQKPLPDTVKSLSGDVALPANPHEYQTPLGVTSRCYQGIHIIVLSENNFGKGYELRTTKPKGSPRCIKVNTKGKFVKNKAGMYLGMAKQDALKILNAEQSSNDATLLYNTQKTIDNKQFDEQTWVDVEFSADRLTRLSVFSSLTK